MKMQELLEEEDNESMHVALEKDIVIQP